MGQVLALSVHSGEWKKGLELCCLVCFQADCSQLAAGASLPGTPSLLVQERGAGTPTG